MLIKKTKINIFVLHFLKQLPLSVNDGCQKAVNDVKIVTSCPKSKEEWDIAALNKNCSKLAAVAKTKNCTIKEKQPEYHCVFNSLRNKLLEVCADKRFIFGNINIIFFNSKSYYSDFFFLWIRLIFQDIAQSLMNWEELFKIITKFHAKNVMIPTILRMPTSVSTLIQKV